MMLEEGNYQVKFRRMPCKTHETVIQNNDGSYTIILNSRITYEAQKKALLHAVGHIINCDFSGLDLDKIELKAHKE